MTLTDEQLIAIRDYGDLVEAVRSGRTSIKTAALIADCRGVGATGDRVAAVKKYRSATGASLKVAQQVLWGN